MPIWARALLFVGLAGGTVAGYVPYVLAHRLETWDLGAWRWLGWPLIVIGLLIYLRSIVSFGREGAGTPNPLDPPRRFVAAGAYRHVRNPMYVGLGAVLVGEALLYEAPVLLAYLLACWLVAHLFVVGYEERTLKRRFGATYEDYRRAVPRWLPSVRPRWP